MIQHRKIPAFCLAILFILALMKTCDAQAAYQLLDTEHLASNTAFVQASHQITALRQAKNLDGLDRIAQEAQQMWSKSNSKDVYFALTVSLTTAMSSTDFGMNNFDKSMVLARKYALLALAEPNVPLDAAVPLLASVLLEDDWELSEGKITLEAWSTQRSQRMKLWFNTSDHLHQALAKPSVPPCTPEYYTRLLNRALMPPSETTDDQHEKDLDELNRIRQELSIEQMTRSRLYLLLGSFPKIAR